MIAALLPILTAIGVFFLSADHGSSGYALHYRTS